MSRAYAPASLRLVPKICHVATPLAVVASLLVFGCSGKGGTDTGDVASSETRAGENASTTPLLSSADVAQHPNFSAAFHLDSEWQPLEQQVQIAIPSPLLSREGLALFDTRDGDFHRSPLGLQGRDSNFPWSLREFPPRAYGPHWNNFDKIPRSTPVFLQRHGESLVERRLSAAVLPPNATASFAESLNEARQRFLQAFSLDEFRFAMEPWKLDEMIRNVESMADLVGLLEANPRSPEANLTDNLDTRVRLIGLFGERAAEAVPAIVRVASQYPAVRLACAGALANIQKDSVEAVKELLNEGSVDEKKFAVAVVGLLGDRANACVAELSALHECLRPLEGNCTYDYPDRLSLRGTLSSNQG